MPCNHAQDTDNLCVYRCDASLLLPANDYTLDERDEECEEDTAAREEYEASLTDGEDDRTTFDMSDDADALASAGWGTDEDYGYYGEDDF